MARFPLLSFHFAFVLCFSFYASSSSASALSYENSELQTNPILSSTPQATFDDLLNLLGTPVQASSVDSRVAKELRSLFKYLVPPLHGTRSRLFNASNPIKMVTSNNGVGDDEEEDENIKLWLPPDAVMEVARLAGGGSSRYIWSLLGGYVPIPDVEGSKAAHCKLTAYVDGSSFQIEELNQYMEFLFKLIVKRAPRIGLNVTLSRFDLFHGRIFQTNTRMGILFHAKEYPAKDAKFPVDLGSCQTGSSVSYVPSQMNLRNILWLAPFISGNSWSPGALLVLDARPNGIIYRDLIHEENHLQRTILEDDLGFVSVEVNYLNVGKSGEPKYQLYLC